MDAPKCVSTLEVKNKYVWTSFLHFGYLFAIRCIVWDGLHIAETIVSIVEPTYFSWTTKSCTRWIERIDKLDVAFVMVANNVFPQTIVMDDIECLLACIFFGAFQLFVE